MFSLNHISTLAPANTEFHVRLRWQRVGVLQVPVLAPVVVAEPRRIRASR